MEVIRAVVWADRSKSDLKRIFTFNKELHGFDKASSIVNDLINDIEAELIGKLDVSVKDQEFSHLDDCKKIFNGHHKISFVSRGNIASIIRVFDMRQHPDKNR